MGASSIPSRLGADANTASIQIEMVALEFTIRKYERKEVSFILLVLAIFYRIPLDQATCCYVLHTQYSLVAGGRVPSHI